LWGAGRPTGRPVAQEVGDQMVDHRDDESNSYNHLTVFSLCWYVYDLQVVLSAIFRIPLLARLLRQHLNPNP